MEGPYTEEEDEDNQSSSSGTLTCSVPEVKPSKPPIYLPGFAKTLKGSISELLSELWTFICMFNFLFIYIYERKLLIQI